MHRRDVMKAAGLSMAASGASLLVPTPAAAEGVPDLPYASREVKEPFTVYAPGGSVVVASPENCVNGDRPIAPMEKEIWLKPGLATWLFLFFPVQVPRNTWAYLHRIQMDGLGAYPKDECFVTDIWITHGVNQVHYLKDLHLTDGAVLDPYLVVPEKNRMVGPWGAGVGIRIEASKDAKRPMCRTYGATAVFAYSRA